MKENPETTQKTPAERKEILQKKLDKELEHILDIVSLFPDKHGQKILQSQLKTLKMIDDLINDSQSIENKKTKREQSFLSQIGKKLPWLITFINSIKNS